MTPRRASRRTERGHAALIVAISAVTLLALTGLALDGGMEAGAYRHAQNAADAGALAAARQEFRNAMASPPLASNTTTLTPVAQAEVQHNNAQLAAINGSSTVSLGTQKFWGPTTDGGLTGSSMLADMWTGVGNLLGGAPVNTNLDLVQTQGSALEVTPAGGGSVASSQVDLGQQSAAGITSYYNCSTAVAHYVAGANTPGTSSPCPGGNLVMSGSLLGGAATNDVVTSGNAPYSTPRVAGTGVLGSIGSNPTLVSVSATSAASENTLDWNLNSEPVSEGSVYATGVSASVAGVPVTASSLSMQVSVTVDSAGNITIAQNCAAASLNIAGTPVALSATCSPVNGLPSIPGVTITVGYVQPSFLPASACTTHNGGNQIDCSVQSCLLRVTVTESPVNSILCLAEVDLGFSVTPITVDTFTGSVTVAATVPQPTYFLRIMGWTQTNPTAQATADLESVVDESQAAFTNSPFGMPDTAWAMVSPFRYESLQVGHTYYLYGLNMQSNSPCYSCQAGWQGELSGTSHRVGQTLTSVSGPTPGLQPYTTNGAYYLEPVFNPTNLVAEYYAVFLPVAGHANWGLLVNSVPANGGHLVQATSTSGWMPFDQGAVAVKLEQ
jgi:hypothetical protein